jgi:hypothetical protein
VRSCGLSELSFPGAALDARGDAALVLLELAIERPRIRRLRAEMHVCIAAAGLSLGLALRRASRSPPVPSCCTPASTKVLTAAIRFIAFSWI